MNKYCVTLFLSVALSLSFLSCVVRAESYGEAEQKAKDIHDIVMSDSIYTEQMTKALYYQNIQIIDLLSEIRDLIRQQNLKLDSLEK